MKPSAIANHERALKWERAKQNKVAMEVLRDLVYMEMKPIALALIERAKTGDHKTAELLFDRTFGKAKENLEVDVNVKFSLVDLATKWAEQEKLKEGNE